MHQPQQEVYSGYALSVELAQQAGHRFLHDTDLLGNFDNYHCDYYIIIVITLSVKDMIRSLIFLISLKFYNIDNITSIDIPFSAADVRRVIKDCVSARSADEIIHE
jgi:hypothetical protein